MRIGISFRWEWGDHIKELLQPGCKKGVCRKKCICRKSFWKARGSVRVQTSFFLSHLPFSVSWKVTSLQGCLLESRYQDWKLTWDKNTGIRELIPPHSSHDFVDICFDYGKRKYLMSRVSHIYDIVHYRRHVLTHQMSPLEQLTRQHQLILILAFTFAV